MEFTYILLIVIIVLLVTTKSSLSNKIKLLELRVYELQEALWRTAGQQAAAPPSPVETTTAEPQPTSETHQPPVVKPVYDTPESVWDIPKPVAESIPGPVEEAATKPAEEPVSKVPAEEILPEAPEQTTPVPSVVPESSENIDPVTVDDLLNAPVKDWPAGLSSPKSVWEEDDLYKDKATEQPGKVYETEPSLSFSERNPDLEKFIGENLINKIGIAILVLAIGYFVKFAIDSNWIGPVGRVGIGVLCGGILIGIAHRMRNSYQAFSSVLVGGGIAVLYFTITLAYHQFHLFNQATSFGILIVITCFAVTLSLLYNRQELAIIALVGGIVSPLMVSGTQPNYNALFIYLIILNAGLLVIAYRKSWRILNVSAFVLTAIMFSGALYSLPIAVSGITFVYASILYLLFFGISVANNIKENKTFIGFDFSILLVNTGLYFAVGLYLLTLMGQEQLRGLFTVSLAVINLLLSYLLFRNRKVDTNVLYLLIGITLTFISLAGPIQLHGHYITLFWAAETVLLYWLYKKAGIYLMRLTSQIIYAAMFLSLILDLSVIYGYDDVRINIIANKGFITGIFVAIASWLLFVLTRNHEKEENVFLNGLYKYLAILLVFLTGFLEINHQFINRFPETSLNTLYLMLYVPAFVYTFYTLSKRITVIRLDWRISTALIAVVIATYLVTYVTFFQIQYNILQQHQPIGAHFAAHWITAVIIGAMLYQLMTIVRNNKLGELKKIATWVLAATTVLFLSMEVSLLTNRIFYTPGNTISAIQTIYVKTGLPVLWGLLSFALMWLGMRYKEVTLRIISLTLFAITLLKLFIFDISNIPPAGKIAAFFCLGILLLIISFMYQKVKKIIVEDEVPKQE